MQYRLLGAFCLFLAICLFSCSPKLNPNPEIKDSYNQELYGKRRSFTAATGNALMRKFLTPQEYLIPEDLQKDIEKNKRVIQHPPKDKWVKGCNWETVLLNDVLAYKIVPEGLEDKSKAIMYLHGGGFVIGPFSFQWKMLSHIAVATNRVAYVPIYRMAPYHPYPAAQEDSVLAYEAILKNHTAENVCLIGDSAGGHLIFNVAQIVRNKNGEVPGKLVALSPVLECKLDEKGLAWYDHKDGMLNLEDTNTTFRFYLNGADYDDPLVNLKDNMDFTGLPPCLLLTGTYELLHPGTLEFLERAKKEKYDITYIIGNKMMHVWPAAVGIYPESELGMQQIADYINFYGVSP